MPTDRGKDIAERGLGLGIPSCSLYRDLAITHELRNEIKQSKQTVRKN